MGSFPIRRFLGSGPPVFPPPPFSAADPRPARSIFVCHPSCVSAVSRPLLPNQFSSPLHFSCGSRSSQPQRQAHCHLCISKFRGRHGAAPIHSSALAPAQLCTIAPNGLGCGRIPGAIRFQPHQPTLQHLRSPAPPCTIALGPALLSLRRTNHTSTLRNYLGQVGMLSAVRQCHLFPCNHQRMRNCFFYLHCSISASQSAIAHERA